MAAWKDGHRECTVAVVASGDTGNIGSGRTAAKNNLVAPSTVDHPYRHDRHSQSVWFVAGVDPIGRVRGHARDHAAGEERT